MTDRRFLGCGQGNAAAKFVFWAIGHKASYLPATPFQSTARPRA